MFLNVTLVQFYVGLVLCLNIRKSVYLKCKIVFECKNNTVKKKKMYNVGEVCILMCKYAV